MQVNIMVTLDENGTDILCRFAAKDFNAETRRTTNRISEEVNFYSLTKLECMLQNSWFW